MRSPSLSVELKHFLKRGVYAYIMCAINEGGGIAWFTLGIWKSRMVNLRGQRVGDVFYAGRRTKLISR
jgi:hypothetical protein